MSTWALGHWGRAVQAWQSWWGAVWTRRAAGGYLLHALVLTICIPALALGGYQPDALVAQAAPEAPPALGRAALADFEIPVVVHIRQPVATLELSDALQPGLGSGSLVNEPVFRAVHRVSAGERLSDIAARYALPLSTLVWVNQLDRGDVLAVGQELRIPRVAGLPHVVGPDDTINGLAARYQVLPEAIIYFGPNRLHADQALEPGQELFVPGGTRPYQEVVQAAYGGIEGLGAAVAVVAATVREQQTNAREGPGTRYARVAQLDAGWRVELVARYDQWLQVVLPGKGSAWIHAELLDLGALDLTAVPETNDFPPPPPIWVWPAKGALTSGFGARWGGFHNGIDIANRAWTPILAARGGRVVQSGWCSGYGYCVKIAHDGDMLTEYGHLLDQPLLEVGELVDAGQLIGYMGSTYDRAGGGYSSGVHLHFTVKVNGQAINPLTVLP